ncbi:putative signal transducing protein [Flavobacterium sp. PLA-1-15]|uniref:putative signal transducing protein n=1 Tax=Flavobacterium sp. PLA-1-15 TaxID=3380533 RepID=UPI003B76BB48
MGLIKIFSGSEILAKNLQQRIEGAGIDTVIKDNIQSARLGGFGNSDLAVEVFIQEVDFGKANPIIEEFRMSI